MALRKKVRLPELVIDTTASREDLDERWSMVFNEWLKNSDDRRDVESIIRITTEAELRIAAIRSGSKLSREVENEAVRIATEADADYQRLCKRFYELETLQIQNEIETLCCQLRERLQKQDDGSWQDDERHAKVALRQMW